MELFQLRYFFEVAKHQHVRKSSEILHVTQPAVTNAIHRLESELGVELFVSSGRNIRLTPCGKFLYEELTPFMESLETLPARLKEITSRGQATVRLNILAAWTLITEAIIEYQRIDNNLHVQLIQNELNELADITVSTTMHYRGKKNDSVYVCTEPIYLAVPNVPKFQGKDFIFLQEVQDDGFIKLSGSKKFCSICEHLCALAEVHPRIQFESDSPSAVKNMISANMGIGFWPGFSWGKVDERRVLLKTVKGIVCSRDIVITQRKNKVENLRVTLFYNWLIKYVDIYSQRCKR